MEDVKALLSHCFGKKRVSSGYKRAFCDLSVTAGCLVIHACLDTGAFQTYLTAVMALQYSEQPDYSALRAGLSDALQQLGGSVELPLSLW